MNTLPGSIEDVQRLIMSHTRDGTVCVHWTLVGAGTTGLFSGTLKEFLKAVGYAPIEKTARCRAMRKPRKRKVAPGGKGSQRTAAGKGDTTAQGSVQGIRGPVYGPEDKPGGRGRTVAGDLK